MEANHSPSPPPRFGGHNLSRFAVLLSSVLAYSSPMIKRATILLMSQFLVHSCDHWLSLSTSGFSSLASCFLGPSLFQHCS